MERVIGVDEAGRGPVLGSMFVAAVAVPAASALPDDVRDSKRLTSARRETLAAVIEADAAVRAAAVEVSVDRIDRAPGDLNRLTASAAGRAIGAVVAPDADPRVVVDACDPDEERYGRYVAAGLGRDLEIVASHRADETHEAVAAASIIAKERREAHVGALADRFGEVGSGYPSDPTTRAFLAEYVEDHGRLPPCARTSWETSTDVLGAQTQGTLADF